MMACWFEAERLLKFSITGFASDPLLACASIAFTMFAVRPSCRKKTRWPMPQSGAVRN